MFYFQILFELKRLQCSNKNRMEVIKIGQSYEGRDLVVAKVS